MGGSVVGCCGNFIRFILGLLSVLFLLIGIALVVLTSLVKWSNVFSSFINTNQLSIIFNIVTIDGIVIALLCIGVFIIILSIVGLIAIISLNKCMLVFYQIVCGLIFLLHLAAFICYFVFQPRIGTEISKGLNSTIIEKQNEVLVQQAFLAFSVTLNCCGANGFSDLNTFSNNKSILFCTQTTLNSNVQGCSKALTDLINDKGNLLKILLVL